MSDVPTRLLRETLRDGQSVPGPGCIDTDTLAAWADGRLGARARAAAETHASTCARCQALLATMARTAPPAESRRFWSLWSLAWLTPVAAATAAVLLWINTPKSTIDPKAVSASAAISTPAPPAPSSRSAESAEAKADQTTLPGTSLMRRPEAKTDQRRANAEAQAKDEVQRLAKAAVPPETRDKDAKAAAPSASPAARADAAPQLSAREMARAASAFRAEALQMSAAPAEVASPDGSIRWRILADGGVARSDDRGLTWQPQVTGAPTPLTAGAAPTSTTCWLVGRGGVIVLSTDGRTWHPVQFPESIDLTAVTATDAAHATVTATDGRRFTTADRGNTWR